MRFSLSSLSIRPLPDKLSSAACATLLLSLWASWRFLRYSDVFATSGAAESKTLGQLEGYTDEFVQGYYDGFTWCDPAESPDTQPLPSPQPTPQQGGIDWINTCNDLQMALVSPCDVLVNPDNTLTAEGVRAVGCIRNGIALAGGGTLLLSLPLPLVIAALQGT